jgi:hypothetical protein
MNHLKVLCKMSFINDKKFHFRKSLTKPKLKIGSNGFLIWVSWHSCLLKGIMCHDYHGFKWPKRKISSFLWQNLTSNALGGSFHCVFTKWHEQIIIVGKRRSCSFINKFLKGSLSNPPIVISGTYFTNDVKLDSTWEVTIRKQTMSSNNNHVFSSSSFKN